MADEKVTVLPVSETLERDSDRLFYLAVKAEEHRHVRLARVLYKRCVRLNPHHAEALCNLGCWYYKNVVQTKPPKKSRFRLRRLVALKQAERFLFLAVINLPEFAIAYYNLGVIYEALGRRVDAQNAYVVCLALLPDYFDAMYNLAMLCERLGHNGVALKWWRSYLQFDPDSGWSKNARKHIQKIQAKFQVLRPHISQAQTVS